MRRILFILVCLLPCFSFAGNNIITGKIVKVSDGDTVILLTEDNRQVKIRLDGIDAPENSQDYGEKSRLFLADMIAGKEVEVEDRGTDFYKRTLGVIYIDGKNVNEELVRNGLAWHYKQYSKDKRLAELEELARNEKLNIWSMKDPVAPWEYRKDKKNNKNDGSTPQFTTSRPVYTCRAITKQGKPCKRKVTLGVKCWQHK